MTCILQSSLSPTQGRSHKTTLASFKAQILDDDNVLFDVEIEYEYTPYFMGGLSIWSFDYTCNGKPNISERDLCEEVKDLIRREERNQDVNFY